MDELDILKKDWNTTKPDHKKLTVNDIYPMLHKKSSSIVKTLFYISIAELVFWIVINNISYFCSDEYNEKLEAVFKNDFLLVGITLFSYAIILLFIYLLYKSYKSISVTDSAKKLMENIIKTRKIIKYYVLYNLVMAGVSIIIGFYFAMHNDPNISHDMATFGNKQMLLIIAILLLCTTVFIGVIWLFYKLIYGLLLKRLNRNYNEIKKLEI
jgi:magnesium-transporting ATPase (P-type)